MNDESTQEQSSETVVRSNLSIFEASLEATRGKSFKENAWGKRHANAVDRTFQQYTTTEHTEKAIVMMIKGYWLVIITSSY